MIRLAQHAFVKLVMGLVLGVAAALLIAFNILLIWVATGPRSLDGLSPYIEATFRPASQSYSVKIEHTWLIWDGWEHPIDIRLRNVSVYTKKGQIFSSFPEISLGIDIWALPFGNILPTSLTINHPIISLFQNEDHSISFGFQQPGAGAEAEKSVPFAAVAGALIDPDSDSPLRKLHYVSIVGADVSVGSVRKGVFFKASDANILFRRSWLGRVQASTSAKIAYDKYESTLSAELAFQKNAPTMQGTVRVNQLMPGTLAALFSDNKILSALKLPVSGKGTISLEKNGTLESATFTADGNAGVISTDKLDGDVPVKALHVEGRLSGNAGDIDITHLTADLDGMLLTAAGSASMSNGDMAVRGTLDLKNAPADKMHLLWPPDVSPMSRQWILSNISDGTVTDATAQINISLGDLAKPILPKDDIHAKIALEGAKIRYLPEHPPVEKVKGVILVDAVSLTADIASAEYMKDTRLSGGKLTIDDLNADNPYINIDFNAESSAKDAVRFLGLPRLKHAARLNLSEATAEGTVKGHAVLGFHFFAPRDAQGRDVEDDITYDITADAKDVAQPGFMKKFDIKNANGSFTVKNSGLEYKGEAEVNGASVTASDIRYLFTPEKGFDTFIDVTARAPADVLPRFGYPAFPFVTGALGVKASLKQGTAGEIYDATLDLSDAAVTLRELNWHKPAGEPASLDLTAEKKAGAVTIPSFHLKGKDMDTRGSAELNDALSDFRRISLQKTHAGNTSLDSLLYETTPGGFRLEAHGASADAGPWVESGDQGEDTFSFAHFPAAQITIDVGRLVTGKGRSVSPFKAEVNCSAQRCENVDVAGKTADQKPFTFRILRNPKGKRQLSLHAESAGAFLKAFDVFDGMDGGDLTIIGNYDDAHGGRLSGRADITEHTIKNAPILAKILSLASLTGFFDTLQGKGIVFTRLRAPFTLADDVLTIHDAKTHGSAMGMTLDGTITFPKRVLDLQGTIIPSYALNNVVGHVPLVGTLLTGGEGQGVFAARYSVKGLAGKPDITVNPLSILTPGFLRGVFDIFDQPDKKKDEKNP